MKKFFSEFKDFISRGNVLDMAIGVIIATAFSAITNSLVNNVLMPLIGLITGGTDFTDRLNWVVVAPTLDEAGEVVDAGVTIGFGVFVSAIINFIIIAFICFIIVKSFNKAAKLAAEKAKREAEAAAALLKDCMEGVMELHVPLRADVSSGGDWRACK